MFQFHDPGPLSDDDLVLVLREEYPGDPAINYVPAYKFKMTLTDQLEEIGNIELRVGNTDSIVLFGGHIAYGVELAYRGHHYAARACRLLLPLARSHGLT